MKVLLTGCDGYVGSVVSRKLAEKGHGVTGLDTRYYKDCNITGFDSVNIIEKDVRDVAASDLQGVDSIIHLAGLSNDPLGHLNPALTNEINFSASLRLAEMAKKAGIRKFVFASSCSMYGISTEDVVTEKSRLEPLTEYAKSKMGVELALSKLADRNFCPVYLRCATIFGLSPKLRFDLVVNNLVGHALTENKIVVNSDGTPWRPALNVEDAARAFILALEAEEDLVRDTAYNTGSTDENYQIRDIAVVVKRFTGCDMVMLNKDPDSRSYRVSCDEIRKDLGFIVENPLDKGVKQLVSSLKELNLTSSDFTSRKYTRLKQIEHLLHAGLIGSDLRWK